MNITRRKFFFFGLAAGVGLLLPDRKIELVDGKQRIKELIKATTSEYQRQIDKELMNPCFPSQWYGIPYHQNDGTIGTWLVIPRT